MITPATLWRIRADRSRMARHLRPREGRRYPSRRPERRGSSPRARAARTPRRASGTRRIRRSATARPGRGRRPRSRRSGLAICDAELAAPAPELLVVGLRMPGQDEDDVGWERAAAPGSAPPGSCVGALPRPKGRPASVRSSPAANELDVRRRAPGGPTRPVRNDRNRSRSSPRTAQISSRAAADPVIKPVCAACGAAPRSRRSPNVVARRERQWRKNVTSCKVMTEGTASIRRAVLARLWMSSSRAGRPAAAASAARRGAAQARSPSSTGHASISTKSSQPSRRSAAAPASPVTTVKRTSGN